MATTGYRGIYRNQTANSERLYESGSLYKNSNNNSERNTNSGALFRSSAGNPGGRPDSNDGIGQEAPLGDGFHALAICCLAYGVIKLASKKGH